MGWSRGSRAFTVLLLISAVGCDGREPLAPSFMFVGAPGSFTATAVAFNQINLTWQDNSTNETGFEVYQSTTGPAGSFSFLATTGPRATSYSDFGVVGSKQYCYEVRAFRTTGRKNNYSDFSAVACATTPRAPVPAAPSGVNASPYYGYAVRLTWTDNSTDETGFRVERAPSAGGGWTTLATGLYPNTTVLTDYQASPEQLRCYRVFAYNGYGDSDPSTAVCTAVPTAPTDLVASVVGAAVNLTWTDNSGVEDGFEVQRAGADGSWSVVANLDMNTTTYHDEPAPDNTYSYFVRAKKDGGTSGYSNTVQVVIAISLPSAPADLNAVPWSSTNVGVSWTDGSTNEEGFHVERSTDNGVNWVEAGITGVNEVWFPDYVPSEQGVCYRVVAFNHLGDSPPSNRDCTAPPAGPTDLIATGLDESTIKLDWTDNSQVEDGYQVWIDDGYGDQWPIASLDPNTTTFQYADYYAYYYYYFVVAVKDGGYSDWSNWAYPTPPAGVAQVRGSPPRAFHPPRQPKLTRH